MNGSTRRADDLLALLEEEVGSVEAEWFDAEFAAIIAASWDATPPPPPNPPSAVRARWAGSAARPAPHLQRRPQPRRTSSEGRRRQRSPPAVAG